MTRMIAFLVTAFVILAPTIPATAQQAGKMYRIGFLTTGAPNKTFKRRMLAFRQGLKELGYVEGKNYVLEERYGEGQRNRMPKLAAELVGLKVDVIVTHGGRWGKLADGVAKRQGRTIPMVFAVDADPVGRGIVTSLARPGGNITGLSDAHSDLVQKRLELLKQIVPSATRVAVLWDPRLGARQMKTLQGAASRLGVTLLPVTFGKPADVDRAFDTLRRERPGALNVFGYALIAAYGGQVAKFALQNRLPVIFTVEPHVLAGGLLSYGTQLSDLYRRAATLVDKILRGAKPAEMPVEQPTRFYLTVNLKTAKALGIKFPPSVLLRADKVIE